jgi:hypothetical protein
VAGGGGADDRWVQLVAFYAPLFLAFVFNLLVYLRVIAAFRKLADDGAVDAAKERMIQLRLRLYLLVFLAVWILPLAHRTCQELLGVDPAWLRLAHTATQCSMGWLNCLVYGCNEATLKPYREAIAQFSCTFFELRNLPHRERAVSVSTASARLLAAPRASPEAAADRASMCQPMLLDAHPLPATPRAAQGGDGAETCPTTRV